MSLSLYVTQHIRRSKQINIILSYLIHSLILVSAAQDAFSQLDKRGEEKIRVGDIQNAMKKVGHNISGDWLESLEDEIDTEGECKIWTKINCRGRCFLINTKGMGRDRGRW